MQLETRGLPFEVPTYSLTGDILSFQRCQLQYRYYNGSALPPSRPVQMWTGEFVHGVLEEAYRYWSVHRPAFPWPFTMRPWPLDATAVADTHDIGDLGHRVEVRLAASGKRSRSEVARRAAYERAVAAVNVLAPLLFPLITAAEERVSGTRAMPALPAGEHARGTRYELTGVVDVISSVSLQAHAQNPLVNLIAQSLRNLPAGEFDLIVDYKAGRRPALTSAFRMQYEWQVQTYAWLRSQVPHSRPVGAAILVYINELAPSRSDFGEVRREIVNNDTDVVPRNGSPDYYAVHTWQENNPVPALSFPYRLARAVHVVDVAPANIDLAVQAIDGVVGNIESAAFREHNAGVIPVHWDACGEADDCTACDFIHFCPSPAGVRAALAQGQVAPLRTPNAPG